MNQPVGNNGTRTGLQPSGPNVTEAVFHALLRTWGLLRHVQEPYFLKFGISGSQWGVLRVLQRAEEKGEARLPLKEVGQRMLIQPPSVTGAVDRLERLGLVQRSHSTADMRVRYLSLTPSGKKLMNKVLAGHADRIKALFSQWLPQEQETILDLLQRLETHLDAMLTQQPRAGITNGKSAGTGNQAIKATTKERLLCPN